MCGGCAEAEGPELPLCERCRAETDGQHDVESPAGLFCSTYCAALQAAGDYYSPGPCSLAAAQNNLWRWAAIAESAGGVNRIGLLGSHDYGTVTGRPFVLERPWRIADALEYVRRAA